MNLDARQTGLFDTQGGTDPAQARFARKEMRATIDRLRLEAAPPWKDQMAIILEEGAFRRAMWLVPKSEAEAFWLEFDAQMDRLCNQYDQAEIK